MLELALSTDLCVGDAQVDECGNCNGDAYVDECGECIGSSSKEGEAENNNSNDGGSFKLDLKVEGTQEPDGTLIIEGGQ